jgi:hypothetical protein
MERPIVKRRNASERERVSVMNMKGSFGISLNQSSLISTEKIFPNRWGDRANNPPVITYIIPVIRTTAWRKFVFRDRMAVHTSKIG